MDKRAALIMAKKYILLIRDKYPLSKAFLFGSFAGTKIHPDSDIDIAVVMKDIKDYWSVQIDLMKFRRSIDTRIEPHPFAEKDFVKSDPLVREIVNRGIQINI